MALIMFRFAQDMIEATSPSKLRNENQYGLSLPGLILRCDQAGQLKASQQRA